MLTEGGSTDTWTCSGCHAPHQTDPFCTSCAISAPHRTRAPAGPAWSAPGPGGQVGPVRPSRSIPLAGGLAALAILVVLILLVVGLFQDSSPSRVQDPASTGATTTSTSTIGPTPSTAEADPDSTVFPPLQATLPPELSATPDDPHVLIDQATADRVVSVRCAARCTGSPRRRRRPATRSCNQPTSPSTDDSSLRASTCRCTASGCARPASSPPAPGPASWARPAGRTT